MADFPLQRTALCHLAGGAAPSVQGGGVRLAELPHVGKVALRGDPDDREFHAAVRDALELDLPLAPNSSSETPAVCALWLGPDEWLLVCAPGSEGDVADALRAALAGRHAAVVDVTDGRAVLRLSGARARTVLAKGCAIDLHPRAFAFGDVVQAALAKSQVILQQSVDDEDEGGPAFDIYVARSFADYLWAWLKGACEGPAG